MQTNMLKIKMQTWKNRIRSALKTAAQQVPIFSALTGGMLALAFAQLQTAFAQTTPGTETEGPEEPVSPPPAENTVDCLGSPLHGRTITVANAILNALPSVTACDQVTTNNLATITGLLVEGSSLTSLQADDFAGLSGLTDLSLTNIYRLPALPAGVFNGLTNLTSLSVAYSRLASLPAGLFDQLANLNHLNLAHNRLTSLPTDLFNSLTKLMGLELDHNRLSALPIGIFDNLENLNHLSLNAQSAHQLT